MKSRKVLILIVLCLFSGGMLFLAGGGTGLGQDAYPVGDVSVSPSAGACVGGVATFSGGGAPAGDTVLVLMAHSPGEFPAAVLGTATVDGAGNWTLTTTVPATGFGGDDQPTAITPGTYSIFASTESENYLAAGTLEVLSSCTGKLPATGFPTAWAITAALLAVTGLGLIVGRSRLRGQ